MNKYIILILLMVSLSSCFTERIDLDLNEGKEKLVVTGWITDLVEPQNITLSLTTNVLGKHDVNYVSGASVSLTDNTNTFNLSEDEKGKYFLPNDWQAKVGDDYTLEVRYNGETFIAKHTMHPCPEIENLSFMEEEGDFFEEEEDDTVFYFPTFDFQENEGEGDGYYGISYDKTSVLGLKPSFEGESFDDEFVDGEYIEDISIASNSFEEGMTAVVEFHSVGKKATEYINAILDETDRGGPFDPPPANVPTNISNGAVGYFIISSARRAEVLIQK